MQVLAYLLTCLVFLTDGGALNRQTPDTSDLRQKVKAGGTVTRVEFIHLPSIPNLDSLVSQSDVVVRARVESADGRIRTDGRTVFTEISVRPLQVLRKGKALGELPEVLRLTILGGTVELPQGGRIEVIQAGVRLPLPGEEYIFFLRRQGEQPPDYERGEAPAPENFVLVGGPLGAYGVVKGRIFPMAPPGYSLRKQHLEKELQIFALQILAAVKEQ
jgi:hypothetical protein